MKTMQITTLTQDQFYLQLLKVKLKLFFETIQEANS